MYFMLVVLLLPSYFWRNHQIEEEYEPEYIIIKDLKCDFCILKQNLREEDNLSTRDKWLVLKVLSVWRFYCTNYFCLIWFVALPWMSCHSNFTDMIKTIYMRKNNINIWLQRLRSLVLWLPINMYQEPYFLSARNLRPRTEE